ncbi:hypothetical protein EJ06DRAFT_72109, partial [Trichodelitschia bisporula]
PLPRYQGTSTGVIPSATSPFVLRRLSLALSPSILFHHQSFPLLCLSHLRCAESVLWGQLLTPPPQTLQPSTSSLALTRRHPRYMLLSSATITSTSAVVHTLVSSQQPSQYLRILPILHRTCGLGDYLSAG